MAQRPAAARRGQGAIRQRRLVRRPPRAFFSSLAAFSLLFFLSASVPPPPLKPAAAAAPSHAVHARYEGGIREAKRHGTGVMLYADGCVFGGKWRDDLKYDGVFVDGSNNWTCGEWDGFVALQALAKIKMTRAKCLYTGNIRQGQR